MRSPAVYHDFGNRNSTIPAPSAVCLTAELLEKGRRLAAFNHGMRIACAVLCGGCIGVSVWILASLIGR